MMNPILPIEQLILVFLLWLGLSGWSAWQCSQRCPGTGRWAIPALRFAALALLGVIAANPGRWAAQSEENQGEWAVLLDSSASMATRDADANSRWTTALKIAGQIESFAGAESPVTFYRFDTDLHPVSSLRELAQISPAGPATDIVGGANRLLERYESTGRRLAGVILLTDGRQVPPRPTGDLALRARALRSPLHPVVLGETVNAPDLAITTRRRQFVAFRDQPLTVTAKVTGRNLGVFRPVVELLDASGNQLAEKQIPLGAEATLDVPFDLNVEQQGYAAYRLRVKPLPGETSTANNETEFSVFTLEEKVRVLLVEGTPYWDSKFIAQLMQRQSNIDLTLIYRLTQDKYFSLGSGEALAAGTVLTAFPDSPEALGRYDLIVVGKGFEYFVDAEKVSLLKQFVRERGGGLIFARGKPYSDTMPDLEALEPIVWDQPWRGEFRWQPTTLGDESGLFGGRLPGKESPVWSELPALSQAYQGARQKAFAQVLVEGVSRLGDRAHHLPVVASQRFGKGLVVAVNSDDLWHWDFFPKYAAASDVYQTFWSQLIHWTVAYADYLPGYNWSLQLSDSAVESGQPVRARIGARAAGSPEPPLLRVFRGTELVQEFHPASTPDQRGQWEGIFALDQPGLFRLELAPDANGAKLFETLFVKPPPSEQDDLSPDRDWIEKLAADTEGRMIAEGELAALLKPAPALASFEENVQWVSAWDRAPWLLLVAAAFALEWFLRRRNGLT